MGGTALEETGVQGSNGISVFGYHMVSTGLSVKAAQKAGWMLPIRILKICKDRGS